jgi:hypothetical protein
MKLGKNLQSLFLERATNCGLSIRTHYNGNCSDALYHYARNGLYLVLLDDASDNLCLVICANLERQE